MSTSTPEEVRRPGKLHGRAVTCTECGAILQVDLPSGVDVPEFFMPTFDALQGDFVHPDRTKCGFLIFRQDVTP
jgi:hypothetical protein